MKLEAKVAHVTRQLAKRIRVLAETLSSEESRAKVLKHAEALEKDAEDMELRVGPN